MNTHDIVYPVAVLDENQQPLSLAGEHRRRFKRPPTH
jgi:hypothetical protein